MNTVTILTREFVVRNGVPLLLEVAHPPSGRNRPFVLFVHGGGWISGDRTHFAEEAVWLAQQGFVAGRCDYRLAPLDPFPAAVLDVQAAIAHVREHAAELGVDPNAITAMGSSAGGHLAAMAALLRDWIRPDQASSRASPRANAAVAISGLHDLREPQTKHVPVAWGFLEAFMGGPYAGREELWREASPIAHVASGAPPFLLFHGDADDVVPLGQSEALHAALLDAGIQSELEVLTGEGHGFTLGAFLRMRERALDFLRAYAK